MTESRQEPVQTRFTEMFGIPYPIVAAPMFLVSYEDLVVGASEAGGLGAFPALNYRPVEKFAEALKSIRSRTKGPVGVNIIVQSSNKFQHQQIEYCLENEVDMIITSLGSPRGVIEKAKGTKTKIFCDVVGLEHAKKVEDLGADGLIAVSSGAGGHAGDVSPFALIPWLRSQTELPLIAAGSIVDGKGMAAALSLGADAIYMGTRFIASTESNQVLDEYKDAILSADSEDIVNTDRVDGFPGNFIKTPSLEKIGLEPNIVEKVISTSKKAKRWISLARAGRALLGGEKTKVSYKTVFSAGHGVSLIDRVKSCEEIIQDTVGEYRSIIQKLPR